MKFNYIRKAGLKIAQLFKYLFNKKKEQATKGNLEYDHNGIPAEK